MMWDFYLYIYNHIILAALPQHSAMPSTIRVDVAFERPVEFAGETVGAIITFKNIAPSNHTRHESLANAASSHPRASISVAPQHSTQQQSISVDQPPSGHSHTRRLSMQLASTLRGFYSSASSNNSRESAWSLGNNRADLNRSSSVSAANNRSHVESLFMGYVQLQGYFQVDETLIDTSIFQHARTHGIIVGHKGLEYSSEIQNNQSSTNGLLKNIGNFLFSADAAAPDNKHLHHSAELSDEIPIFTTPQSLLFVDLKLAPGESRSYSYHFTLPKELPPSCRGKSIKIMYNMVIGTQKTPSRPGLPTPKIVLVPFRLFSYVDPEGGQAIHDLANPIVVSRDESSVMELEGRRSSLKTFEALTEYRRSSQHPESTSKTTEKTEEERAQFHQYVESLLDSSGHWSSPLQSKRNSYDPTQALLGNRRSSNVSIKTALDKSKQDHSYSVKDNIHYFVKYFTQMGLQSEITATTAAVEPRPSPFKFSYDIVRKNQKITTLNFSHSVYRVGDEIIAQLDMSDADIPCYHITATLETTERLLDPSISLESESKTQAVTRRIYSHYVTSSFGATKTHIQLTIPSTATPQFSTSLTSLNWSIKLDLITSAVSSQEDQSSLLEPVSQSSTQIDDPSYNIYTAKPVLPCESFSCRIPIQVYPTNQDISALLESYAAPQQRVWVI